MKLESRGVNIDRSLADTLKEVSLRPEELQYVSPPHIQGEGGWEKRKNFKDTWIWQETKRDQRTVLRILVVSLLTCQCDWRGEA